MANDAVSNEHLNSYGGERHAEQTSLRDTDDFDLVDNYESMRTETDGRQPDWGWRVSNLRRELARRGYRTAEQIADLARRSHREGWRARP